MADNSKKNHSVPQHKSLNDTPSTPDLGYSKIYPKSDGLWYYLDDSGIEQNVSGESPTLQVVTDLGNTTYNPINVHHITNPTEVTLKTDGTIDLKSGSSTSNLANTNVTTDGVKLEFPNKAPGSYTIATTDDLPGTPGLQEVTDINNVTTNSITIEVGDEFTTLDVGSVTVENSLTGTYSALASDGSIQLHNGVYAGELRTTNITNSGIILEFPNKTSGSYTIATLLDLPTVGTWGALNYPSWSSGTPFVKMTAAGTFSLDTNTYLTASSITGLVPYTGATSDVNLGTHLLTVEDIQINTTPTTYTPAIGKIGWNDTDGTLEFKLKGGGVTLQIGQEQVARVVNKTSPLITLQESAYQAVVVTGATGQRLSVRLAQANSDANSSSTIGVVTETIAPNQEGFITTSGQIHEINTTGSLQGETWVDGDVLYLSATTAGAITNIKPVAPAHTVIIGYVEYAHSIHGKIFVKVDNGYELDELHNVSINSGTLSNNDGIFYDLSTGLWKNKTIVSALGYTPVTDVRNITINGTTQNLLTDRTFTVTDANLSTSDITTNDVSTTKHGFAPKAPNDTTKFLRGDGTWAVAGLNYFTEAQNTSSPNATVPVDSLTAVSAATNADIAIIPKGTGAILADIPDNLVAGGNKRGTYAVDLQMVRLTNAAVASGNQSVISGGYYNTASGQESSVGGGYQNTASGTQSRVGGGNQNTASSDFATVGGGTNNTANASRSTVAGGSSCTATAYAATTTGGFGNVSTNTYSSNLGGISNTASGDRSTVIGGSSNTASASYSLAGGVNSVANGIGSIALGTNANSNGVQGRSSYCYAGWANGDAQSSTFIMRMRTTDATLTTFTSDGTSAASNNQVILSNNSAFRFKGTIIAKQTGSTNASAWDIDGLIVRGANAAATTLLISNVTLVQNTPGWGTPTLSADTTQGGLKIQIQGLAGTNIQWVGDIKTTEVIY